MLMSDKSQYLKAFNEHFIQFVTDIHKVFPEDDDILFSLNALKEIRKMNPKLIIMIFNDYVVKNYRNEIMDNNIDFFLNKDYSNDMKYMKNANSIVEKINNLREPIKLMNNENKQKTLKYLQNLIKLCDFYN